MVLTFLHNSVQFCEGLVSNYFTEEGVERTMWSTILFSWSISSVCLAAIAKLVNMAYAIIKGLTVFMDETEMILRSIDASILDNLSTQSPTVYIEQTATLA